MILSLALTQLGASLNIIFRVMPHTPIRIMVPNKEATHRTGRPHYYIPVNGNTALLSSHRGCLFVCLWD